MAHKAQSLKVDFRPHFKTHQSAEIGEWFRLSGVTKITVSSVQMAGYFAEHGWADITIAFPVNILEIDEINILAEKIKLNLLIENKEALSYLEKFIRFPVGIYLKINTGYNRTGIPSGKTNLIDALLARLKDSSFLKFEGFLSHTGQTYHAQSRQDTFSHHFDALLKMRILKNRYRKDWPNLKISLGDTPSCSICENFNGVDEIRPGNFVFYDLMQEKLGSCSFDDIAVRVACPVVSTYPSRNEVVIYGGAIHLSKEQIINIDGKPLYGRIILKKDGKEILLDEKNYVSSLSQEHGILKVTYKDFSYFKVGELVEIVPVHSCLTANLMGQYLSSDGTVISMIC
jgi:D-serine deaminase-like pyridoxal phosphate-dependent protein